MLMADKDECLEDSNVCVENADCQNVDGGYVCSCQPGYVGDGDACICE